jgi:hypothetical protein
MCCPQPRHPGERPVSLLDQIHKLGMQFVVAQAIQSVIMMLLGDSWTSRDGTPSSSTFEKPPRCRLRKSDNPFLGKIGARVLREFLSDNPSILGCRRF